MTNAGEIVISEDGDVIRLPIVIARNTRRTNRKIVPKLLRVAGRIPFADDLAAAYYCALDPATPRKAKVVLFAALAYFVLPVDAVPDMLAGLGFTDDATVLAAALSIVGMHIKDHHRRAAWKLLGMAHPSSAAK